MTTRPDYARLDDLVEFARIEVAANDLEPWAEVLGWLRTAGRVTDDEALWLISLYNTYDDLGSAFGVFGRWATPDEWAVAYDGTDAADFPCTQERRNLRGGKVLRRLDSYVAALDGRTQRSWAASPLVGDDPRRDFKRLLGHLRGVWGVGRQSAFEWAEFLAKAAGFDVHAPDAELWESEGPRRSLQRLYGRDAAHATPAWLNDVADHARHYLAERGVDLEWEDFETVICDFNVMRDGRYYPGRHLAALREEIDLVKDPEHRAMLDDAWAAIVPAGWAQIAPGIDKTMLPIYRETGTLVVPDTVELDP